MTDITFHGAARNVTGSSHLLRIDGTSILIDCGLFQGRRAESYELNSSFPFDPASINVMVLSHAHIDHSGKIPMLYKHGFRGSIICTAATRDLANIMLLDSAFLQQKDAEFVNKLHAKKGLPPVEPIYGMDDVVDAIGSFQTVGYGRKTAVTSDVDVTFYDAGHILGSAVSLFEIRDGDRTIRLCYTGDLGRPDRPILRDPEHPGDVDYLISESTYGGRFHLGSEVILDRLEDVIKRTVARSGKIIVPAFSVGRTQELVYHLHELREAGRMPDIPVFVDSPLSVNATQIFRIHPECMDTDARQAILTHQNPFSFENLRYITHVNESKSLNARTDPMIIISSSGMCEGGRILHHLINNIEDERNTILITGYNAEYTLGRRIVERDPIVKIFGEEYHLNAEVVVLNSLSAHADSDELIRYHGQFDRERLRASFLVHGDLDQAQKMQHRMEEELGLRNISIPSPGDRFEL
ncbi:MAG: MBL fold metallo-hydrolase [Bacteroidetes bacterium]|nr:MBL fold metallo-hydrolase [Bacteroidota bacterium]